MRKFFSLLAAIFLIGSVSVKAETITLEAESLENHTPFFILYLEDEGSLRFAFAGEEGEVPTPGTYTKGDYLVYVWLELPNLDLSNSPSAATVVYSVGTSGDWHFHFTMSGFDENPNTFIVNYDEVPFDPIDPTNVAYIDVDGTTKYVSNPTEITGSSAILGAGWYFINKKLVSTGQLTCSGDVNLILVDGTELDVTGDENRAGILVTGSKSLTIYGQENQSGRLKAIGGDNAAGIGGNSGEEGRNITINGGDIWAESNQYGAGIGGGSGAAGHNITINGGHVYASTCFYGAGIGGGYNALGYDIQINGGYVDANGGGTGGWNGIGCGSDKSSFPPTTIPYNIKITDRRFVYTVDGVGNYSLVSHSSDDDLANDVRFRDHTRIVITDASVNTNYAEDKSAYFSTYYDEDLSYQVTTPDATVYTAAIANEGGETVLSLYELADNIIPVGTPVIIESASKKVVHMDPYMASVPGVTVPNDLLGTNDGTTVAANTVYTLAAEDGALAFYEFSGTEIPAHKAYLQLPAGVSAPRRISFGSNVVTGMENVNDNSNANVNTNKVLRDGQLLIRKNGHLYNAQGVVVE